jgi:predicted nucleotidyltransferase
MKKIQTKTQAIKKLQDNKQILEKRFGVKEVAIFDSYVKNTQHKHSDIDILVSLKQSHVNFDNYMELKFYLAKIIGRKIDLILKDSIREELKPAILNSAVYV